MLKPKMQNPQIAGCVLSGALIPACATITFIIG